MKILFLSQSMPFPVYRDGITVRVYHLLKELGKRGECYLLSFSDQVLNGEQKNELAGFCRYETCQLRKPSGPAEKLADLMTKLTSPRRFFSAQFAEKLARILKDFDPEVVLAEQTFMAQYVNVLKDTPKILSAVDAISLAARRISTLRQNPVKKLAWKYIELQRRRFEKRFLPIFDGITVVGSEDAEYLRMLINRDVYVIPNGVDIQYFRPPKSDIIKDSIVFSGNLSAPKNEESCIYLVKDVFPILRQHYDYLKFQLIGRNPTKAIYRASPPYVNITGEVPDMALANETTLVFVCPDKFGTGIKNSILQAMAMEIPVVVTPAVARQIGIIDGLNGLVATREGFTEAIHSIVQNEGLRERLAQKGRQHVIDKYSWKSVAFRYLDLLARVSDKADKSAGQPMS